MNQIPPTTDEIVRDFLKDAHPIWVTALDKSIVKPVEANAPKSR